MKILQNETTNDCMTTSSTGNSKEIQQFQQHLTSSLQQQQSVAEKRKAKTLKNKILQNVAQQQQQQQQEEIYHHQERHHQQDAIVNNKYNTPSAMTDERTKFNYNNNCNNTKTNNNTTTDDIKNSTTSTEVGTDLLKDSLKHHSSSSGVGQNKNSSSSNSDLIIAEAAKILLKNGLNGTNAAAAAAVATATATLLTAAASFHQIPTSSNSTSLTKGDIISTSSVTAPTVSDTSTLAGNVTTAATANAHAQLVAIAAAAAAVNATNQKRLAAVNPISTFTTPTTSTSTCKSPNATVNNGSLDCPGIQSATTSTRPTVTQFTKPYKTSSCKSTMSSSMDVEIFDHAVNFNSNSTTSVTSSSSSSSSVINLSVSANNKSSNNTNTNIGQQKFLNNNIHTHSNRPEIGRAPISHQYHQSSIVNNHKNNVPSGGYGGRLQFFKDGKFILELARSKDGEKGGWVSVPRKIFRTPSAATSSTVTPSASASTSVAAIPSPLAASPAAVVVGTTYPKNECSNSLSFSDDNSSLQSSPWQRDHCWKQASPRKNVSKELKNFYRRPTYHKFTAPALALSQRKRRKPYDTKTLENDLIFVLNSKKQLHHKLKAGKSIIIKKDVEIKNEIKKKAVVEKKDVDKRKDVKSIETNTEVVKTEIVDGENKNNDANEECNNSSDNKLIIKSETLAVQKKDIDDELTKVSSPSKTNHKEAKSPNVQGEAMTDNDQLEKMNTSECAEQEEEEDQNSTKNSTSSNGDVTGDNATHRKRNISVAHNDHLKKGDEEKRLKKHENIKTRAKLTTIVQKLIDVSSSRLAATAHRLKASNQSTSSTIGTSSASIPTASSFSTSNNIGLLSGGTKNQNSKVSPPTNAAASRLVEYHQQHVSPRKRILRELEKVSLEENSTGVKRSRAKGNSTSTASTNSNAVSSSTSTTLATNKITSLNAHNLNAENNLKSVVSAAPTKLYSSYSIHSLLGSGLSTSTTPTPAAKKPSDLPATITSSSMAYSPYHIASYPSNSLSNNSPKSPEGNSMGGGKSPSNSATKFKRSPPYSSPMPETPSRSSITCGSANYTDYSGRRSPRSTPDAAHNAFNKMRYTNSGSSDVTASPTNHHLHHQHHLQQHYQQQPQTYYSPYMIPPHYVPPPSGPNALSPNAASGNASTSSTYNSRSPRHLPSAFRATTPTSSSATHNIPSTQKGDLSPQRSTTASPRETTPRTVPKKTASIRRQFASPTSATTQNHNTSNCSSPITTIDEQLTSERRTPVNCSTSHQQHQQAHHLMQRSSPGNSSLPGSPIHPYSYLYTQPQNGGNSSHISNVVGSTHPSSSMSPSSAAAVAAAAAAAASYIPAVVGSPYYHPYISTLAAMRHPQMWMQHYQNAAAAAANPALMQPRHPAVLSAAARLSPPYGFQYNGVGNAAALAAAAAAAGFSTSATPSHLSNALNHPSSIFNPMANSSLHGMQHSVTAMQTAGLVPASAAAAALSAVSPMTDTTDISKTSKNHFSSSTSSSTSILGFGGSLSTSSGSPGNSMYTISNKDEQSSDVPLNLSKH